MTRHVGSVVWAAALGVGAACASMEPSDIGGTTGGQGDDGTTVTETESRPDRAPGTSDSSTGSNSGEEPPGTGTGSDTGDSAGCPIGTHACTPMPPGGWIGPIAIQRHAPSTPTPACIGGYGQRAFVANGALQAGDPSCSCRCSEPSEFTCGKANLSLHPSTSRCSALSNYEWELTAEDCTSLDHSDLEEPFIGKWKAESVELEAGPCTPVVEENIPEPAWDERITACEDPEVIEGCDEDSLCVPRPADPFQPGLCVYKAGDVPCPQGAYSERTVWYQGFQDDRECTKCECGDVTGSCNAEVFLFDDEECEMPVGQLPVPTDCTKIEAKATRGKLAVAPTGSCEPSGGELQGTVSFDGAVTVCCAPYP